MLKKLYMSLHNKLGIKKETLKQSELNLSKQELEFLMGVLGETSIKGKQVEFFYSLVLKLQKHLDTM